MPAPPFLLQSLFCRMQNSVGMVDYSWSVSFSGSMDC